MNRLPLLSLLLVTSLLSLRPGHALAQARRPAAPKPTAASAPRPAAPAGQAPIFPSPEGVYAVVSNVGLSKAHPTTQGLVGMQVLRAPAGSTDFEPVSEIRLAGSLSEFRAQAGQAVLDNLKKQNQLATDAAAWEWVQAHPALDDYGLLALDMHLRVALGTAGLDAETAKMPVGTRLTYRLLPLYAKGQGPDKATARATTYPEATVVVGQRSALRRPRAGRAMGRDSSVVVRWVAPAGTTAPTLFGRVWRRGPGDVAFVAQPQLVLASRRDDGRNDSLYFTFDERVAPESFYRYYLEPLDFVGNPGPASDTVNVLSVSAGHMPTVHLVTARDTAGGIWLRWPALADKPYLLGIEVQRSRDTRGNYVRLDTIPASASSYLDTRLLPNITYHYRLRALLAGGMPTPEGASGAAFAAHQGHGTPLAPVQLTAVPEERGVRLRWLPGTPADPAHEAYFVYRGTSLRDSLQVVSPALRGELTTFLDTTARDGRREYTYAVRNVDKSLQSSPFSNPAFARPHRPMRVEAPLGLSGYANAGTLHLSWDDVQRRDPDVVGYRLYRRPAGAGTYALLASNLRGPAYDDASVRPGQTYDYTARAVDALGTESPASPAATLGPDTPAARPPATFNVRAVPTGIEVSWSQPVPAPAKGYALYRRLREQAQPQRLATLGPDKTRFVDLTARPGTLYLYSLSELSAGPESPRTAEAGVRR